MLNEIGILCVAVCLLGGLAFFTRQPIIPAFIIAGVIVGPLGLKLIHDPKGIQSLSEITVVFVMFLIGLEMNVKKLKSIGSVVTLGAVFQVVGIGIIGMFIVKAWFDWTTCIYLGIFFTFGSTMLAVKLMADQKQQSTLNGRISLGILLMQDILAIIILSVLAAKQFSTTIILGTGLKSLGIVVAAVLAGQFIFPSIFRKVAKSPDLMTPVCMGICFIFAFLAENQGLSASIGAFVTGVSLANLPYSLELTGRVKTLRDFFLPIFFASLGLQLTIPHLGMIMPIIVLIVTCVFLKPILISVIIAAFGYQPRTSFLVGETLMPISEFGLIIIGVGITLGHITGDLMTMCMVVMMVSMLSASYLRGDVLYKHISKLVKKLDRFGPEVKEEEEFSSDGEDFDAILIGCHNLGRDILELLCGEYKFKVIEIEPERLIELKNKGYSCLYGDVADPEVWERIGDLSKLKLIVSTIADLNQTLWLIKFVKESAPNIPLFVSTDDVRDVLALYEAGADKVICAYLMAGRTIGTKTADIFNLENLEEEGKEDKRIVGGIGSRWHIQDCVAPEKTPVAK